MKIKSIIKILLILSIIVTMVFPYSLISFAVNEIENNETASEKLKSNYYKIDKNNNIISLVEPETNISVFKNRVYTENNNQSNQYKIYKNNNKKEEVTTGIIKTGMVLEFETIDYGISVVGDIDGDGRITQLDLTAIIRHIVGLQRYQLSGVKKVSANITLDGTVDQRDLTKMIKYLVYGRLDLGKEDTMKPEVNLEATEVTQTTMKVKASAIDRESGLEDPTTYKFTISTSDGQVITTHESTETEIMLDNLEPNTEYKVKAEVKDKAGNIGKEEISVKTLEENIPTAEGIITFENITWNAGKASLNIKADSDYYIEYQIVNENENKTEEEIKNGTWTKSETKRNVTVSELNNKDIVYARLTNGRVSGEYVYKKIEDTTAPIVTLTKGTITTNSISVTAGATDNETGMPNSPTYTF